MLHPTLRLRHLAALVSCVVLSSLAPQARAVIARLDDSASPRGQVGVDSRNAQIVDANTVLVPFGQIEYRLSTAAYVGRRARIYYVIPPAIMGFRSPAGLQVQWRGNGSFASGAGRPGDRVPVWNGVVAGPWMNEAFDLSLRIDPRELRLPPGMGLRFESTFEIETMP